MEVFECTSIQRQLKGKCKVKRNSSSIANVHNKNNDNNRNKVIIIMKVEQQL